MGSKTASFRNITVVVNPVAGFGAGIALLPRVLERLPQFFPDARITSIETQSSAHASEIGASVSADLLVIIGGDGTLHHVVQGVLTRPQHERPTVSLIAVGSGNDYARTLGIPSDAALALEILPEAVSLAVDVGCAEVKDRDETIYYLETLSFGVDAAVAINTMELRKTTHTKGLRLYARAAISAVLNELKPFHASCYVDGSPHEFDLLICAVQNGPTYGSGFKVAPRASITDGLLNICVARRVGTLRALYYLLRIKSGTHEQLKAFSTFETSHFEIKLDHQLPVQCDGEQIFGTHFDIRVLSGALNVLVPRNAPVLPALAGDTSALPAFVEDAPALPVPAGDSLVLVRDSSDA